MSLLCGLADICPYLQLAPMRVTGFASNVLESSRYEVRDIY